MVSTSRTYASPKGAGPGVRWSKRRSKRPLWWNKTISVYRAFKKVLRYCIPQVSNANNFSSAFTMFPCPFLKIFYETWLVNQLKLKIFSLSFQFESPELYHCGLWKNQKIYLLEMTKCNGTKWLPHNSISLTFWTIFFTENIRYTLNSFPVIGVWGTKYLKADLSSYKPQPYLF